MKRKPNNGAGNAGGTSGQSVPKSPKSKFRQKSQQEQAAASKLRMEKRGEKLEAAKEGPWRHFTADSNYPPTKATDKVWSEAAQFETERQGFLAATGKLLEAARSKDEAKVRPAYEAVHDACRSCHKTFKK